MKSFEWIEKTLDYIEYNLKYEINIDALASIAGYSKYHFIRLFKEITHLTPSDYIRKRRLSEVAREIAGTSRPVSDIAFEYGFNSKENFTRAFLSEHNVLPTEYKSVINSLKLYERFSPSKQNFNITPKIITIPDLTVIGYFSDEEYVPNFWNKYNCKKMSSQLSGGKICADYGVSIWNKNKMDYFIGINKENAEGDTTNAEKLFISGGLYAVFATPPTTHFNFVNTVHMTWQYIFDKWLPHSGYQLSFDHGYQYETYIEESRSFSEDIYIPIKKL